MPFRRVDWTEKEEITSAKLNEMAQNDNYLYKRKADAGILNMGDDRQARAGLQVIKDNVVVYGEYREVSPGGTSSAFAKRMNFPSGFFDPEFLPSSCLHNRHTISGIKISYTIRDVDAGGFTVVVREHAENEDFKPSQIYYISYLALGIKN